MKLNFQKKHIIGIILVILIPLIVEIGFFNFNALVHSCKKIEYRPELRDEQIKDVEKNTNIINVDLDAFYYVNRIFLNFSVPVDMDYQIVIQYENSFGQIESKIIYDSVYKELPQAVTKIKKKIKAFQIILPENLDINVSYFRLSNDFYLNRYRLFILYTVAIVGYLFIYIKSFLLKKIEWLFAITCFLAGCCFIFINGSGRGAWDEEIHFANAYSTSFSDEVVWSEAAWRTAKIDWPYFNTYEEKSMETQLVNEKNQYENALRDEKNNFISMNKRLYIPQALFLKISRFLGFSFNRMYMFGKLGNLLTYIALIFIAIRKIKSNKIILAAISLLPTLVLLASSYSYDAATTGFLILGLVVWYNEVIEKEKKIVWYKILIGLSCMIIGCYAKAIYIPLILLYCMFHDNKFIDKKQKRLFNVGVGLLFILVMATFVLPAVTNAVGGNASWGADLRGGDTSVTLQLKSILLHPVQYILLFVKSFCQSAGEYFYGSEGWMNLSLSGGTLPSRFIYLLMPLLLILFFVSRENSLDYILDNKYRIMGSVLILLSITLIWTALYLSFSSVGAEEISGVQARYYAPFLLLIGLICKNNRVKIKISKLTYNRICMGISIYLLLYAVYFVAFTNKVA